jgi:hypothetical protein
MNVQAVGMRVVMSTVTIRHMLSDAVRWADAAELQRLASQTKS